MQHRISVIFLWVLIFVGILTPAYAEMSERFWEFDVQWAGIYHFQVEHYAGKDIPKNMKATYSATIKGNTSQRSMSLVANQMFVPMSVSIQQHQTVHMSIKGPPKSILQETFVHLVEQDSYLPGKHLEYRQNRDFKELRQIRELLEQPEDKINFTHAKLMIDKMVEPSTNIKTVQKQIDGMVSDIKVMLPQNASSNEKVAAIKAYLYQKGSWNFGRTYQYDFDDPLGAKAHTKLIANYIRSRKGNCISMPFLFIMLGERLGIDVTASIAPLHVFVKYRDEVTGELYNLETTSGANPSRDIWYRQQHSTITDQSLKNGVYLQKLSKKETVVVMADFLLEHYTKQQKYERIIALCDLMLKYYPKYVYAMIRKGSTYSHLITQRFVKKYPDARKIPAHLKAHFHYLSWNNQHWFTKAEALGWREPSRDHEAKYLQRIKEAANNKL